MSGGGGGPRTGNWNGATWDETSRPQQRNDGIDSNYGRPHSYNGGGGDTSQWGGGGQNDYQGGHQHGYGGGGGYGSNWGGQPQPNYQNSYGNGQPNSSSGYMNRWGVNRPQNHEHNGGWGNSPSDGWGNGHSDDWGASQRPRPNSYNPPPGPPPGYYGSQAPNQSQNLHPSSAPHGPPRPPGGPGPLFPPSFVIWHKLSLNSTNGHFCIGTNSSQEPLFSAKRPEASGKVVLRSGSPKHQGPELARIEGSSTAGTMALRLSDGTTTPVKKKQDSWSFSVNIHGRMQTFTWASAGGKSSGGGLSSLLLGGGSKGPQSYELKRDGEGRPLAKYAAESGGSLFLGLAPKTVDGHFDFLDEAASGQLGHAFAAAAVVCLLKMRHKKMEQKEAKMAMKLLDGGLSGLAG